MSDIFREIDEEVRRERYLKLWQSYGHFVLGAVLVVVLLVAGVIGWREYSMRRSLAESVEFSSALALARDGHHKQAAQAFEHLAGEAGSGYAVLAELRAAAALAAAGDKAGAVAAYDRLAEGSALPQRFRDLAALLAAFHSLDTAEVAELERRLAPLTADSTWRYTARELAALVRLKAGDYAGARQGFTQLADDAAAPTGLRGRAAELLAALPEVR